MKRRGAVHQHGVALDDVLEDAPDHGILAVDERMQIITFRNKQMI